MLSCFQVLVQLLVLEACEQNLELRWGAKAYCFVIIFLGFETERFLAWNNKTSEISSHKTLNKATGMYHRCQRKNIIRSINYKT